ncbi:pyridoxal-phosphate-dependent aminotransferase family protein [Halarsenatibacter silvermanii]|uniref:Aspartate aminotransferase n=1 Tax=Halarsenatibacter silvermanii TaxID=321763 RepID=A0A1G9MYZ4_9FIRM|nr:alanine--glyoxylate aminotransferase family protein [Halarsenatibacter silvermanii]SDL79107.1 aspartate aminotransferase [Halarsenatibacter silvermanii]
MENEKYVMIPGPTPVVEPIQNAMGRKTAAFKDPEFVADFESVLADLKKLWKTDGEVFVVPGSGTLAMEMSVSNTLKSGDKVLIISHGYFGDRFVEIAERKNYDYKVLSAEWGTGIAPEKIREELSRDNYRGVIATHVDTSTGVKAPIEEIGRIVQNESDAVFIVDGVCATAAEKEYVDPMNIDILFTGSQKAFGVPPGLALIWAGPRAMKRRNKLGEINEYYGDFEKWLPIMHDPSNYFGTPAVNLIWALKASLSLIKKEGLESRFSRHERDARAIQAALETMGFEILAEKGWRAHTLSNVLYPEGINDEEFRDTLREEGAVVAGGLGDYAGKLFRLGHMGNIDEHVITSVLQAIERTLYRCGKDVDFGAGMKTYMQEKYS